MYEPGHFRFAYYDLRRKKTTTEGKIGNLYDEPIIQVSISTTLMFGGPFTKRLGRF